MGTIAMEALPFHLPPARRALFEALVAQARKAARVGRSADALETAPAAR